MKEVYIKPYNLRDGCGMHRMILHHKGLILKHFNGINGVYDVENLKSDIYKFYIRYNGKKSPFVVDLCKLLCRTIIFRIADSIFRGKVNDGWIISAVKDDLSLEEFSKFYDTIWEFIKNFCDGDQDHKMTETYWNEVFQKTDMLAKEFDFQSLEHFVSGMLVTLIVFLEDRQREAYEYEETKKKIS